MGGDKTELTSKMSTSCQYFTFASRCNQLIVSLSLSPVQFSIPQPRFKAKLQASIWEIRNSDYSMQFIQQRCKTGVTTNNLFYRFPGKLDVIGVHGTLYVPGPMLKRGAVQKTVWTTIYIKDSRCMPAPFILVTQHGQWARRYRIEISSQSVLMQLCRCGCFDVNWWV